MCLQTSCLDQTVGYRMSNEKRRGERTRSHASCRIRVSSGRISYELTGTGRSGRLSTSCTAHTLRALCSSREAALRYMSLSTPLTLPTPVSLLASATPPSHYNPPHFFFFFF